MYDENIMGLQEYQVYIVVGLNMSLCRVSVFPTKNGNNLYKLYWVAVGYMLQFSVCVSFFASPAFSLMIETVDLCVVSSVKEGVHYRKIKLILWEFEKTSPGGFLL